jgi:hypothetical protein
MLEVLCRSDVAHDESLQRFARACDAWVGRADPWRACPTDVGSSRSWPPPNEAVEAVGVANAFSTGQATYEELGQALESLAAFADGAYNSYVNANYNLGDRTNEDDLKFASDMTYAASEAHSDVLRIMGGLTKVQYALAEIIRRRWPYPTQ